VEAPGPGSRAAPVRRTLTPAVVLAAGFAALCAFVSISFVAGRGGLLLPLASPGESSVALVSLAPDSSTSPVPSSAAATTPSPEASLVQTFSPPPSVESTAAPTPAGTPDPLAALPACPDHPGCYLYTIRRGDTLSTVSDRWLIGVWLLEALNPQVTDPSTIVVGQTLYLGRSPFVRLDRCPDVQNCYLYVVRPGDRLSTIAGRFAITTAAILALNPRITDPNAIYSGQTIRLPGPTT
jgi:nucleoid-associated protein YgaU